MAKIEDAIRELLEETKRNTYASRLVLTALYRREQTKEADKVPPLWRPYTVLVPGLVTSVNPQAFNVFPRNPKRSGFTVLNSGTGTNNGGILFGPKAFDVNQVLAQLGGQSQGVVEVGILANNQQLNIVTSGPLFVSPQTTTPAILTIIMTEFLEQTRDTSKDHPSHQGYSDRHVDIEANEFGNPDSWQVVKDLV